MSLNMKSTLEVEANGFARFVALMGEMVPILEREGWKLEGAFMHTSGRLNTVVGKEGRTSQRVKTMTPTGVAIAAVAEAACTAVAPTTVPD